MYCIIIYHEHDADTSVNGPYESESDAKRAMRAMATDLANGVEGRQWRRYRDTDDDTIIVYNADYEHEPSDDDWHIELTVDRMGDPRV